MAKQIGTYQQLLLIRNDIVQCKKNSIVFALFNSEKIKNFSQRNAIKIQMADEKIQRLIRAFVKHDDEDKPKIISQDRGMATYEYLNENAAKAFDVEYKEFMSKTITIEY